MTRIATYWRNEYGRDQDFWFLMCIARLINNIDTLAATPLLIKDNVFFRNGLRKTMRKNTLSIKRSSIDVDGRAIHQKPEVPGHDLFIAPVVKHI